MRPVPAKRHSCGLPAAPGVGIGVGGGEKREEGGLGLSHSLLLFSECSGGKCGLEVLDHSLSLEDPGLHREKHPLSKNLMCRVR